MPTVQFRTAADVIAAFGRVKNAGAWSLWDGSRFMFKGSGREELEAFLDLLNENGASNAVYTLKYYEGPKKLETIKSKTDFDGSFNFRLNSDNMEVTNGAYKDFMQSHALTSRVNGLESKLDLLIETLAKDPEPEPNRLGIVGEILEHPAIAPLLPGIINALVGPAGKLATGAGPAPRLSAIPAPAQVAGIGNVLEQDPRLAAAVGRLCTLDPNLAAHLDKLATLGERDPATFNYILTQLDKLVTE